MTEEISLEGLRRAIRSRHDRDGAEAHQFESVARRFESAVQTLMTQIQEVVEQIPELSCNLEEGTEEFTSPAFPDRSLEIRDPRLKVVLDEDYLLFDPTAKAHFTTLGQVELRSSRPIPFLMEKVLYLMSDDDGDGRLRWGFRSTENIGGGLTSFGRKALLKMVQAVFA